MDKGAVTHLLCVLYAYRPPEFPKLLFSLILGILHRKAGGFREYLEFPSFRAAKNARWVSSASQFLLDRYQARVLSQRCRSEIFSVPDGPRNNRLLSFERLSRFRTKRVSNSQAAKIRRPLVTGLAESAFWILPFTNSDYGGLLSGIRDRPPPLPSQGK